MVFKIRKETAAERDAKEAELKLRRNPVEKKGWRKDKHGLRALLFSMSGCRVVVYHSGKHDKTQRSKLKQNGNKYGPGGKYEY